MKINKEYIQFYRNEIVSYQQSFRESDPAKILVHLLQLYYVNQSDNCSLNKAFVRRIIQRYTEEFASYQSSPAIKNTLHPFVLIICQLLITKAKDLQSEKLKALFSAFFSIYEIYQQYLTDAICVQWKIRGYYTNYFIEQVEGRLDSQLKRKTKKEHLLGLFVHSPEPYHSWFEEMHYISKCHLLSRFSAKEVDAWVVKLIENIPKEDKYLSKICASLNRLVPMISSHMYPYVRGFLMEQMAEGNIKISELLHGYEKVFSKEDKCNIIKSLCHLLKKKKKPKSEYQQFKSDIQRVVLELFYWLDESEQYDVYNFLQTFHIEQEHFVPLVALRKLKIEYWKNFLDNQISDFIDQVENIPVCPYHRKFGKIGLVWDLFTDKEKKRLLDIFISYYQIYSYYFSQISHKLSSAEHAYCLKEITNHPTNDYINNKLIKINYAALDDNAKIKKEKSFSKHMYKKNDEYYIGGKLSTYINLPEEWKKQMLKKLVAGWGEKNHNIESFKQLFSQCHYSIKQESIAFLFKKIMSGDLALDKAKQKGLFDEFNHEQIVAILNLAMTKHRETPNHLAIFAALIASLHEDCSYHLITLLQVDRVKQFCNKRFLAGSSLDADVVANIQSFHPADPHWKKDLDRENAVTNTMH